MSALPVPDWRTTLRRSSELALVGIVTFLACVPLLTAGASLATASAAVHHWCDHDELPPPRELARVFARGLLPGVLACLAGVGVGALALLDLLAVRQGRVPGGPLLAALLGACALLALGTAALVVAEVGARGGQGWRAAAAAALARAWSSPALPPAAGGVVALAGTLAWLLPASAPVLPGFALFALHVVRRRLGDNG